MKRIRCAGAALLAAVAFAGGGCGRGLESVIRPNIAPTIHVTASVELGSADELTGRVSWTAGDPDGRVDHCLIGENPASVERVDAGWRQVTGHSHIVRLRAPTPGALQAKHAARAIDVVAVRAVDDEGAMSEPATAAFLGADVAPTVEITQPQPTGLREYPVSPTVRVEWRASDSDAPRGMPREVRYKLFRYSDDPGLYLRLFINPDTLNALYAPGFSDWKSVRGDSTGVVLSGLTVGERYLLVVTALDREGAWDPVFTFRKNMLRMQVLDPGTAGPLLTIFSGEFFHRYFTGGIHAEPVEVSEPSSVPIVVRWSAAPLTEYGQAIGNAVDAYRWTLDPVDLADESPRHPESRDLAHWSQWSTSLISATIGPFAGTPGETHDLYVEARDVGGFLSLGHVRFNFATPSFTRDLLIVDDTRLVLGETCRPSQDSIPRGPWPTSAELDTFLFAVGGVQWRRTPHGTLSAPGVFHGYSYDSLVTWGRPDDWMPSLEFLGRYRHVAWIIDATSATFSPDLETGGGCLPQRTALRLMSSPNHESTLAAYVRGGGNVWLIGGGASIATLEDWNYRANDRSPFGGWTYSSFGNEPDLLPGHLVYDFGGWRSEIKVAAPPAVSIRRDVHGDGASYAAFPSALDPKSPATDPLPPLRRPGDFYLKLGTTGVEFLGAPNLVADPRNPSPQHRFDLHSLDTVYVATGTPDLLDRPSSPGDAGLSPCMTYAHPPGQGTVMLTGFDIWHLRRDQSVQLVDAMLQGVWGLSRGTGSITVAGRLPPTHRSVRPGHISASGAQ
jgi:hypothetical protein